MFNLETYMPTDINALFAILINLSPAEIQSLAEKLGPCQLAVDLANLLHELHAFR